LGQSHSYASSDSHGSPLPPSSSSLGSPLRPSRHAAPLTPAATSGDATPTPSTSTTSDDATTVETVSIELREARESRARDQEATQRAIVQQVSLPPPFFLSCDSRHIGFPSVYVIATSRNKST
jgi:hypothetical protein